MISVTHASIVCHDVAYITVYTNLTSLDVCSHRLQYRCWHIW